MKTIVVQTVTHLCLSESLANGDNAKHLVDEGLYVVYMLCKLHNLFLTVQFSKIST